MSNITLEKCPTCGKLMSKNALILHLQIHNSHNRPVYCIHPLCVQVYFDTKFQLAEHYKFYHELSDSNADNMINGEFGNEVEKFEANLSDTAKPPRLTVLKPVQLIDASLFNGANQSERSSPPVRKSALRLCKICKVTTTNYMRHINTVHNSNRPFKCDHGCIQTFFTTSRMQKVHMTMCHTDKTPSTVSASKNDEPELDRRQFRRDRQPCSICGRNFRHNLSGHMQTHSPNGRPFQCKNGCIRSFWKSLRGLYSHNSKHHNRVSPEETVEETPTNSTFVGTLPAPPTSKIDRRHPRARLSSCAVCGRQMMYKVISSHMKIHESDGRPFQCTRGCVRSFFTTQHRLTYHYWKVHGEKRATDKIDHKTLNEYKNSPVRINPTTASRFKPCPICGKNVVGRHMASHNPVGRQFQCTRGCARVFFRTKTCQDFHNRTQHGIVKNIKPTVLTGNKAARSQPARNQPARNQPAENQPARIQPARIQPARKESETSLPAKNQPAGNHPATTLPTISKPRGNVKFAKLCSICDKPSSGTHMAVHDPVDRPFKCMKGCIQTFCRTEDGLRTHNRTYHPGQRDMEKSLKENQLVAMPKTPNLDALDEKLSNSDNKSQIDVASTASSTAKLETKNNEIENKRRRESVTAMIIDLPATASEFEKKKLLDLYRICQS